MPVQSCLAEVSFYLSRKNCLMSKSAEANARNLNMNPEGSVFSDMVKTIQKKLRPTRDILDSRAPSAKT
jgi:hypothetical protein